MPETTRARRPNRPPTELEVVDTEHVTPSLVRVNFRSEDLSAFDGSAFTDRYVKMRFPVDGEEHPVVRTYTALEPDVAGGTLAVEFVVHGDSGVAGPWAAQAQPGDRLSVNGPGGAYAPDPTADWHLLVGDESAIPAIRAALQALEADQAADAVARVVVEVAGPDHEVALPTPGDTSVVWVHRGSAEHAAAEAAEGAEPALLAAVRAVEWLPGRVQCFVHGEAQVVMHGLRPYLLHVRDLPRDDVSVSGYWRRGRNEEGFREWKSELRDAEG